MFITHRKDMLIGDFLIDDRLANGAANFNGKLLRFGWDAGIKAIYAWLVYTSCKLN